uniref:Integral membrane protein-like protein n=1 Tax=Solibacter usitatus (strain Ellin6076) TaxID=234267 RepID=Q02CN8_SOLUE
MLFVVQPIMAKSLLPRFGGSASVWITCMLFFQVALLLGYLYSFCLTRYLGARAQSLTHIGLLTLSLGALPLRLRPDAGGGSPTLEILYLLATSVGLPYFALSATSPLLQSWLVATRKESFPYRLFALSNAASLLALLAYPAGIEPFLSTRLQMAGWSVGYVGLVVLVGVAAVRSQFRKLPPYRPQPIAAAPSPWLWIALAACASTLWLAITNHLGQQVAAMPFLWIIPMAVYLLTFILCFEADGWYRPELYRWLMPIAWIAICSRVALASPAGGLRLELPIFCAALFICCMFCHGELARSKPAPQNGLALFYLTVACGGALGGIFVGLVAPNLFGSLLELPLGVTASVFLALYLLFGFRSPRRLLRLGVVAALAFAASTQYQGDQRVARSRNFYGSLQISDVGEGEAAMRTLYSGRTIHGLEFLSPARRRTATTYYGLHSGVGMTLGGSRVANRRVAIVGLGAGTLATYGKRGDFFRFYEINPAVVRAAAESFHFLSDSEATTDVVTGDGRLMLGREPPQSFDMVVLDAFSDDAIPVHLLTREAFEMYFGRLRADGLLLIHLSNRYLDLNAEVQALATDLRKVVLRIYSTAEPAIGTESADWAIVAGKSDDLAILRPYGGSPSPRRVQAWTDEYSSLFPLWK